MRLITIPISHYCEKARWALDRAGLAYREERHVQLVHRFAARRAGGGTTVPVLVTADRVLAESAEIVAFAGVPPGDAALERELDATLGPEARSWMYVNLLPRPDIARAYNCAGVPAWEACAFPLAFPAVSLWIRRHLELGPDTAADAQAAVQRSFDAVAARLGDGRRHLCGDTFTASDLTFASLAAAVLLPPEYGVKLPALEELPPAMAAVVREFRAHPAGAYALRLFREERRRAT